jgi:hypothetical protein
MVAFVLKNNPSPVRHTFSRVAAPKKLDDRQFQVGDHVTVSLSAGRIVGGVVKAIRFGLRGS